MNNFARLVLSFCSDTYLAWFIRLAKVVLAQQFLALSSGAYGHQGLHVALQLGERE